MKKKINHKKILVFYNSSKYSDKKDLIVFLKNYKRYKSGIKHKLLVCFKNLEKKEILKRKKILKKIKYIPFIDPEMSNDFEWGSQKRVSELYKNYFIMFLNDYSYPICDDWLKIFSNYITKKSLIASMGSLSSHANNSLYRKKDENYSISFFFKIIYFFINYDIFPNPNIRTTGYMYHSKAYLDFFKNKTVTEKKLSLYYESGKNSFSKFFIKKKFSIFIVNSDNKKFDLMNGKKSKTFASDQQQKLIISDKRTRSYLKLNKSQKRMMTKQAWGEI